MKINIFNGTDENGVDMECATFEEAEKLIKDCSKKRYANISFNHNQYPNLLVQINGKLACLWYDGKVGECLDEFDLGGKDPKDVFYFPSWVSNGDYDKPVRFLTGSLKKTESTEAERIVTLEQAIACIAEFYKTQSRPENIVNWERRN